MTIGYFCSAGFTETGGMGRFLARINPDIEWKRCFPAVNKPGPKLGAKPVPRPADQGATGRDLERRMMGRLRRYHPCPDPENDGFLLIDDADCRFCDASDAEIEASREDLAARVAECTGRPFFRLLASPEIEAWLVSDWEEGFGRQYANFAQRLRARLRNEVLDGETWEEVENFGCPLQNGTCARKLSREIETLVELLAQDGQRYSKRTDGVEMLRRIRPDRVSQRCRRYFRPVYLELQGLSPMPGG